MKINSYGNLILNVYCQVSLTYVIKTLIDNEEYRIPDEWMRMCNLRIPQRIKFFLWRMLERWGWGSFLRIWGFKIEEYRVWIFVHIVILTTKMTGMHLWGVKRQSKYGVRHGNGTVHGTMLKNATSQARWQPRHKGHVKCNIDVALFGD